MNAGQITATRGTIARMTTRVVAAITLIALAALSAPAQAHQPPPKCKFLSQTRDLGYITKGDRSMEIIIVTTKSRCRGKVVTTVRWVLPINDGPR